MTPDALLLVALSALSLGFYNVACKHAVSENSAVDVLLWSSVAGLVAFLAAAAADGGAAGLAEAMRATPAARWMLAGKVALVGSSWAAGYLAMRRLPISLAAPVRATAPLWTLLGAIALYGETPGPVRALGMSSRHLRFISSSISVRERTFDVTVLTHVQMTNATMATRADTNQLSNSFFIGDQSSMHTAATIGMAYKSMSAPDTTLYESRTLRYSSLPLSICWRLRSQYSSKLLFIGFYLSILHK